MSAINEVVARAELDAECMMRDSLPAVGFRCGGCRGCRTNALLAHLATVEAERDAASAGWDKASASLNECAMKYEALRADAARLDTLDALLEGADFAYGEDRDRHVVLLRLPAGVRIGADIRAFADAAREAP